MHDDYLMTGCYGVDNDTWQGVFYDDDLPGEWRIAFYSTLLRSVLLPVNEWHMAIDQDWAAEVDDDFRFLLQIDDEVDDSAIITELAELPEEFSSRVAGVVVSCDASNIANRKALIQAIRKLYPVCVDTGAQDSPGPEIEEYCRSENLSRAWYPAQQASPLPAGDLLVTFISGESLPEQRDIISQIAGWLNERRSAGLINTSAQDAPVRAQETRVLAELMGV